MIESNLNILQNNKSCLCCIKYINLSILNKRFQVFFTGRIFLEGILNKKNNLIVLLKEFFSIKEYYFNEFYLVKPNFRKKFSIINTLIQCDIFSFHNLFHAVKYRNKEYFEILFTVFLKDSDINFIFLHKIIIGKPIFELLDFFHFLPSLLIKLEYFNFLIINLLKIKNSIKKILLKLIETKKKNLKTTFKNNGILFEFFLNFKILNNVPGYGLNNFYTNPSFLVLIGLYKKNISSFFFRFTLCFLYISENLFLFFLNKKYIKTQLFILHIYTDSLISDEFKANINFFIKINQSIANIDFCNNILSLILYKKYLNDFDYLNFLIQNKKHFLIKCLINKIKISITYKIL
jgi:hypothetical protein